MNSEESGNGQSAMGNGYEVRGPGYEEMDCWIIGSMDCNRSSELRKSEIANPKYEIW